MVEAETDALVAWIDAVEGELVSSNLARRELLRAVRRGAPDRLVRAREVLDSLTLIDVTTQTFEGAGESTSPATTGGPPPSSVSITGPPSRGPR